MELPPHQTVAAGSPFQVSFQNGDSGDKYRVYLAASLAGHSQGPTCEFPPTKN